MDVQAITLKFLHANGFDGLYNTDICACKCDDLMPCDNPGVTDCQPGYLQPDEEAERQGCDFVIGPNRTHFDLIAHLHRQRAFSEKTFGPGARTAGVCDHIRKELIEVEASPNDVTEWADVILLAFDGAWRAGFTPEEIAAALGAKQTKNEARTWPDWRTADPNKAIEHVKDGAA
ncbi:dATP/dGTP pyrophosphohydrolase domain-containing protein [Paludibacterium purpuratum]|uniref:Uncharacterized protein DUF550 n=1 Tax=Paludibacterium purpuratum TaxID=1144873 RepID=A0A4R7BD99_9NEIS|nr:dATP/dGTP pyrophosphohydrolase domain-containing protein [Paludibacterium purpuratum]TDR82152.1 uncharacterized protein DUF550 [Paludibacterium purpuratum]